MPVAPSAQALPAMDVNESALIVLGAIEHLSVERDRERMQLAMLRILADLCGAEEITLHGRSDDRIRPLLVVGPDCAPRAIELEDAWPVDEPTLLSAIQGLTNPGQAADSMIIGPHIVAHGLYDARGLAAIVTIRYVDAGSVRPWWIGSFLKVYQNHVNLINDAECDTLTGLFNRKTFEARINRVLAMQREAHENPGARSLERRAARPGEYHWLAVVDIDHFKSVNDRFGHLYGDEVLILLARLMMRGFRMEDRLFRFGGEEFVIVLSPCAATGAAAVLERFRSSIEHYEFPQVGRVTASIGYTRIRLEDMPSVAVGRADEALYYAKRNGRNRVCSFESLAASGDLLEAAALEGEVTLF
jgi:diguanylate cyclase (GGDEF)-like protein